MSGNDPYSPKDRMHDLLSFLQEFPWQKRFKALGMKPIDNMSSFEKIMYAKQAFLQGALPELNTLLYIALSFEKYIQGKGDISLDEAFQLQPKPKAGNPSKQYASENHYNNLLFEMACLRADKKISIEDAAFEVCERQEEDAVDMASTLCRKYSSGNWKNIESFIPKVKSGE